MALTLQQQIDLKKKKLQLLEMFPMEEAEVSVPVPEPEMSAKEKNAQLLDDLDKGQAGKRFLRGMFDPVVGTGQLLFNSLKDFTDLDEKLGITTESLAGEMRDMNESSARGQKAHGRGEFDAMRLGGNIVTGIPLTMPFAGAGLGGAVVGGGLLGGMMPTTNDDFWGSKGGQVAAGMVGGSAGYGAGKGIGWLANKASPYFQTAEKATGRAIRSAIGEDKADAVIRALRADINPLTKGSAGEISAGVGSTRFAALQKAVDEGILPDEKYAREVAQNAARMGVVDDIAGQFDDAVAYRAAVTNPLRANSLGNAAANTTKEARLIDDLAAQDGKVQRAVQERYGLEGTVNQATTRAQNYSPVPGQPKVPFRYAPHQNMLETADEFIDDAKIVESLAKSGRDMLKYQQDSMKALGIEGAKGAPIMRAFDEAIEAGAGSPLTTRSLRSAAAYVKKNLLNKDGTVSPEKLYQFRKEGLNEIVERMAGKEKPSGAALTEAVTTVRGTIDDVIEKAAGGGWKDYLATYNALSKPVDQARIGRVLQKALGDSLEDSKITPRTFTNALDDQRGTLRKAKVLGKTLDDTLNESQIDKLGRLRADVTRSAEYQKMAADGSAVGKEAMGEKQLALVNPLIREIMVTNAVLKKLSQRQQDKVIEQMGIMFKRDPDTGFKLLAGAIEGGSLATSKLTQFGMDVAKAVARPAPGVAAGRGMGQ
jgi:hypothetical protein